MCPFHHSLRPRLAFARAGVMASPAFASTAARAQAEEGIEPPLSNSRKPSVGLGAFSHAKGPGSDQRKTRVGRILGAGYGRFSIGALPGAGYSVAPQWQFGRRGSLGRFQGGAANSPRTFRAKQADVGLFPSCRF
jgi:hypothetical protein